MVGLANEDYNQWNAHLYTTLKQGVGLESSFIFNCSTMTLLQLTLKKH